MNRTASILTIISAIVCLSSLILIALDESLRLPDFVGDDIDPNASFAVRDFHCGVSRGAVWFFNDNLPYTGSIWGAWFGKDATERIDWRWQVYHHGMGQESYVEPNGEVSFQCRHATFPGIYFRHFEWPPKLGSWWTLAISLWYVVIPSVILPAWWSTRKLRARWKRHPQDTSAPSPSLIILLGALSAFSPLAIDMYLPAFPEIERDLTAPAGTVPLTLSFFLAGLAIGQFVVGPISDRLGRRLPLLVGCAVFGASAALCGFAPSVGWLIASRFVMGFAGAAGLVISRAVVRDLCDETTSAGVYSFIMMVTGVAPVVAPLVGGAILVVGSWRLVFAVLAAVGIACGVAVLRTLRESLPFDRRSQRSVGEVLRRSLGILTDSRFIGYALAIGSTYGALFAYIAGSPAVFMDQYGLSPQGFSLIFASNAIGIFLAAQVNRWLLNVWGPHRILQLAARGAAGAGCLLVLEAWLGIGGFYAFYATLFVCVASLGLIFPNATAAAMTPFGQEAGAASAVLGLLQYAVGAGSGAAVGLLANGTAVPMAGVVAVCEITVWVVVAWTEQQRLLRT